MNALNALRGGNKVHWLLRLALAMVLMLGTGGLVEARVTLQVYLAETSAPYVTFLKENVVPAYEAQYPGVQVELQMGTWSVDAISVRYAGGAAPDVIQLGSGIGAYEGMLLDLNPYTQNWRRDLNDFPPGAIDAVMVRGQLLAIPYVIATRTLTYRKDFFAQSGLNPDGPPSTWNDLVEYGKRLVRFDADGVMIRQGFETGSHYHDLSPFLFQAGGNFMSEDLTRITFADDPGVEAVEFMSSLFHVARISAREGGSFNKGLAAMNYAAQTAISPEYESQTGIPNEDVGVALPPKHKRQAQLLLPNSWAVINISSYPQQAWDWIAFASSVESCLGMGRATGVAPPRRSMLNYAPWNTDPRWKTTYEAMSLAVAAPIKFTHFDDLRKTFVQPALGKVLFEQEPIGTWKEAQRQAQAWLDDLRAK